MPDLESIISGAVDAAENGSDDAVDTSTDTTDTVDTDTGDSDTAVDTDTSTDEHVEAGANASAKAEADAKALADAEEAFAKEHGLLDKAGKRENRVPYSRVKAIVANAEKKLAEALFGDKLTADKPYLDQIKTHTTRFTEIEQENQGLKTELGQIDQVEQIMLQRPEQFLELLPHINPKFAELLPGLKTAAAKAVETPAAELPKPDMKVKMPDGSDAMTYSTDGVVGLIKAVVAQTKAELQKGVDDKLKPLTDREAAAQTDAQIIGRLQAKVNHARENWKGFKDWEKEIQAELAKDRETAQRTRTRPKLDLHDAYIVVKDRKHDEEIAKLKTDRETQRKEIVKEINASPRSTAIGAVRKPAGTTQEPKSMEDVIKEAVASAGLK